MKPKETMFFPLVSILAFSLAPAAAGFEGRITAALTRGGDSKSFLYTVSADALHIERTETDRPHVKNIVNLKSGEMTLVFPHNGSFVRLKRQSQESFPAGLGNALPPGALPPGIGPQSGPAHPSAAGVPAGIGLPGPLDFQIPKIPQFPAVPKIPAGVGPSINPTGLAMPAPPVFPMSDETLELKATGEKKELLGHACTRYEIKRWGEVMEIWATENLLPFQPYLPDQPGRFGPRMIEEQWAELLKTKKLFPLLVVLKSENGTERLRFEVKRITPEKIDDNGALFQPPPGYQELQPSPF